MVARRLAPDDVQLPSFAFTSENQAWAQGQIAKYPEGRQASAVIPLLWQAQKQAGGWLPRAAIERTAEMLGLPYIRALEVATFYTMFNLAPVGRYFVQLCGTTPCALRGANELKAALERRSGPEAHVSADGLFSWTECECLGACCNAPMVQINDDYYEDLTPESLDRLLDDLAANRPVRVGSQTGRSCSEAEGGATTLTDTGLYDGSVIGGWRARLEAAEKDAPKTAEAPSPKSETPVPAAPSPSLSGAGGLAAAKGAPGAVLGGAAGSGAAGLRADDAQVPAAGGAADINPTSSRDPAQTSDIGDAALKRAAAGTPVETGAPAAPVSAANAGVSPSTPEALEQNAAKPKNAMRPEEAAASAQPTRDVPNMADRKDATPSGGDPGRPVAPEAGGSPMQASPNGAHGEATGPKADAPERLDGPRQRGADDLTAIAGLEPETQRRLNGLGIFHYAQVAAWTPENVRWVDEHIGRFEGHALRDRWVDQAKKLCVGYGPAEGVSDETNI